MPDRTFSKALAESGEHLRRQIDGKVVILCVVLLVVDLLFVLVHAAHEVYISLFNDNRPVLAVAWHVGADRGYAEVFGYVKLVAITALLLDTARLSGRGLYLIWAVIFALAGIDDAFAIHERIGAAAVAPALSAIGSDALRGWLGELAIWVVFGGPLVLAVLLATRRATGETRRNGIALLLLLAAFVVCAAGVDLLHSLLETTITGAHLLLTVIEDGGEQVVLSVGVGLAMLIRRAEGVRAHATPPRAAPVARSGLRR